MLPHKLKVLAPDPEVTEPIKSFRHKYGLLFYSCVLRVLYSLMLASGLCLTQPENFHTADFLSSLMMGFTFAMNGTEP